MSEFGGEMLDSNQCEASYITRDAVLFRCQLPKGHDGSHEDHHSNNDGCLWMSHE